MPPLRIRLALCALLFQFLPAIASIKGNDACQALMIEGDSLLGQGKTGPAWDAFERAHKADPAASMPLSKMAYLLMVTSRHAPSDKVATLVQQATASAQEALRRDRNDPLAREILRDLEEGGATPLHRPSPAAAQAANQGENLFAQRRYDEALAKYELAAERDPQYSSAWVFAGDCFFAREQWQEAAIRFRKATSIEPLNGQAWRYLSDALLMQGEHEAAQAALLSAIAAHPSQLPNWEKLDSLMSREGMPMKRLNLVRKVRVRPGAPGSETIIEMGDGLKSGTADQTVWLLLGIVESGVKRGAGAEPLSAFGSSLAGWRVALEAAAQMEADGKGKLDDPALLAMQKLAQAGQLEPAILLLMYREAYRPDFEAWKRAHPDGIKAFIATYGLRP